MRLDAIKEGFCVFQDCEHASLLQGLIKVLNVPEYGWIMPEHYGLNKLS